MVTPHVKLDPESLTPVTDKLQGALEDQLTSAVQAAADRVGRDYSGESVDKVATELDDETRASLHADIAAGFAPNPSEMHAVAEAIVRDHT